MGTAPSGAALCSSAPLRLRLPTCGAKPNTGLKRSAQTVSTIGQCSRGAAVVLGGGNDCVLQWKRTQRCE
eukprot:2986199-Lingulodinium_polyedra.AAC.1